MASALAVGGTAGICRGTGHHGAGRAQPAVRGGEVPPDDAARNVGRKAFAAWTAGRGSWQPPDGGGGIGRDRQARPSIAVDSDRGGGREPRRLTGFGPPGT